MPSITSILRTRSLLALAAAAALGVSAGRADAQRGAIALETLRSSCVTAATSEGYSVIGRSQETRSGNAYSAILQLRNNVRTADYTCTTDGRGNTRIPGITDVRGNGVGYGTGVGRARGRGMARNRALVAEELAAQRERARELCASSASTLGRGFQNGQVSEPVRRNDGLWEATLSKAGNGNGRGNGRNATRGCRYDPSSDRANLY